MTKVQHKETSPEVTKKPSQHLLEGENFIEIQGHKFKLGVSSENDHALHRLEALVKAEGTNL